MQITEGQTVDVRYYGAHDQISTITGTVADLGPLGIVIKPNDVQAQFFPWGSVQRLILDIPKDSLS